MVGVVYFDQQMLYILTSVWSVQHPNAGRNTTYQQIIYFNGGHLSVSTDLNVMMKPCVFPESERHFLIIGRN